MFCDGVRMEKSNADDLGLIIKGIDLTEEIEVKHSSQSLPSQPLSDKLRHQLRVMIIQVNLKHENNS